MEAKVKVNPDDYKKALDAFEKARKDGHDVSVSLITALGIYESAKMERDNGKRAS